MSSLEEARQIVQKALPHAIELPVAKSGFAYPSPPKGIKTWFQIQPPEPKIGNNLPHIKYVDWTGGKKGLGVMGSFVFPALMRAFNVSNV